MTHQFKFGDMVRHKKYGIGVISYVKEGNIDFYVSFKDDSHFDAWINAENLELIPHPDTARLDWLAAQDDIDITLGNTVQLKPCLRAHIDAAMQEQAAEAKE